MLLVALLLGVVQGLTEFIPVSSSAHLVLTPFLLGVPKPSLAFDVALHMGTAAAVVLYFRSDLRAMARALRGRGEPEQVALYRRLVLLLAVATVPVAIVGYLAEDVVAAAFASPLAASLFLFVTAAVLFGAEATRTRRVAAAQGPPVPVRRGGERVWRGDWVGDQVVVDTPAAPAAVALGEDLEDPAGLPLSRVGLRHALLIGLAQTVALFPGISRSGVTISAGMVSGLTREAATRFSFLLALPALLGAGILSLGDLAEPGPFAGVDILVGVAAAFASGYLAIRFLIALVARDRLTPFARYAIVVGLLGLFGYVMLGPPSSV